MEANRFFSFFPILLKGFKVKVRNGWSIAKVLTEHYGLTLEYIEDRIKCVFLNGAPADDVELNTVEDGSTLSLCDAVPGLAGSIMRRDTAHLRSMRSLSAHELEKKGITEGEGFIHVKLFNLMVRELGRTFLDKGIWISGEELEEFLKNVPQDFWAGCRGAEMDGQKADRDELSQMKWSEKQGYVFLSVGLNA
jgi:hypothetical protein